MPAMITATSVKQHSKTEPHRKLSLLRPDVVPKRAASGGLAAQFPAQSSPSDAVSRKHAQERIEASEDIRRYIARELHDDIGQRLSLLSIKLALLQQLHTVDDSDGNLAGSLRDLDILISDVHSLSHSLHSSRIERHGLASALREIFSRLQESYGTHIDFFESNIPDKLPPGVALCFFRIAQESLNNAIKHGGPSSIQVDLMARHGMLLMRVKDFGAGFDKDQVREGLGLVTMKERIAAIGGELTVDSELGTGTVVTASANLLL
jgi:signal transduction histidine kinase